MCSFWIEDLFWLEDLFEKSDMKMETWELKIAKRFREIPIRIGTKIDEF